jgi:hypothetical protein
VRLASLNWNNLGYEQHDLSELEDLFVPEEIKQTVMSLPSKKALGLDGFVGLFYKKCWTIIQDDPIAALRAFHSLRTQRLHLINEANVVLIPKTNDAINITDFRLISLINSLAKIITKILADHQRQAYRILYQDVKLRSSKKDVSMTTSFTYRV